MLITYTGTIYHKKQDINKVFKAAMESGVDVTFDFYGNCYGVMKAAEKYNLKSVNYRGLVSKSQSLEAQRHSNWLLLLDWEGKVNNGGSLYALLCLLMGNRDYAEYIWNTRNELELGVVPGKLFEYMASGRPILLTGGNEGSEAGKIIKENHAGIVARTVPAIIKALRGMI